MKKDILLVCAVLCTVLLSCNPNPSTPVSPAATPTASGTPTPTATPTITSTSTSTPTFTDTPTVTPTFPAKPFEIHWFIGLGSGATPEQVAWEQGFVEDFNAAYGDRYHLIADVYDFSKALKIIPSLLKSANPPDIVGPSTIGLMEEFAGSWLDLSDLMQANGYDVSDFNPGLIDFYKFGKQGQVGIPFSVFPSALWYNKDLFDAAGIAYPPHKFESTYQGSDWDFAALREIAMKMTVDTDGRDAFHPDFDPASIRQFGYHSAMADLRGQWSYFGAGNFIDSDGRAVLPEVWRRAAHWHYDGMWKDHFIPTSQYFFRNDFGNLNTFQSGKVAMMPQQIWYTCCYQTPDNPVRWDVAAIPSFEGGKPVADLDAQTFVIPKTAKNPQVSFEVLSLFLGKYAERLLSFYGGIPARKSLQTAALATYKQYWPEVDWQVFIDALGYPDNPSHEAALPKFNKARSLYENFRSLYETNRQLNLDAELDRLISNLSKIFPKVQ